MNALGDNVKAPWPVVFNDVAKGIDYLNEIKDQENLDLSRVLIIGHSAGGLLATWAASRLSIPRTSKLYAPTPLKISAVLSIAGILDLSSPQDIDQPNQINRLMGGTREQYPERYRAGDPNLLSPAECKLTVFHGEQDKCVGINQAINYSKNAKASITQIFLPDADHFSMLPHEGNWQVKHWRQLKDEIAKKITVLTM
jgi:acetyl esterase/lipase